jgi:aryl sulfotransferase
MPETLPQMSHIYQHYNIDSTRWNHFKPRGDDIIVATPPKCGTTWMQTIIVNLIFQDLQPHPIDQISPWLDSRPAPLGDMLDSLEAQTHRRIIKSHLPLDGLLFFSQLKYVVVGRDARDVFMSYWNHYSNFTPAAYDRFNNTPGRVGDPLPRCPENIREFWQDWISRGWFAWESQGYPTVSMLHHLQSWWEYRSLPNILLVHYNDLLSDLAGEIQRVADFLNIEVAPPMLASITDAVSFQSMKQNAKQILPDKERTFIGGAQTFINKGTNGRWRDVLTDDDLKLYEAAVTRELTPDCADWLEHGRLNTQP